MRSREYVRRTIDGEDVTPATIEEVLNFYNMATRTILDYMATTIGKYTFTYIVNAWQLNA